MGKKTEVDGDNNPTSQESDPTKLLEAALQQMDGIIAEAGGTGGSTTTGPGRAARARALELAQQLASSLQHAVPPPPRPDFTTASAILRWLQQNNNSVALGLDTRAHPLWSIKTGLLSDILNGTAVELFPT
ncbi:hypothetical protein PYW08_015528 [Mythimna loreyi]|uniref:Uncharacterized protein n=1 Tax=Mythimna loreyi TaxID=667449 RepID=A0ACC2QW56_9NEOP|nr:hypothetical protein PYW08_015528 [Mythimna loreyi]